MSRLNAVGPPWILALSIIISHLLSPGPAAAMQGSPTGTPDAGERLYQAACAACHGADGTGLPPIQLGFETPVPDFTDCSFASREPDADWFSIIHQGGPIRAFDRMMPAFGEALSAEEIMAILAYVREFCGEADWPRGELNLPRAMFTEKAYPEDEAVWTTGVGGEGWGEVSNELIYERRFGARNQIELILPFGFRDAPEGWKGGIGDVGIGVKRAVFHDLASGTILSLAGEVIVPTGNADEGFGVGVARLEPFLAFGQVLPSDGFMHLQAGAEFPVGGDEVESEAFWRGAIGKSFTEGRFGRTWSPMVEVLAARELTNGATTHWDVVPQFQVTLNTRQHVMANVAARVPVNDTDTRRTQLLIYLLLDWFDGGLLDGW
jgi:mono/diheme cytochrome c family protein